MFREQADILSESDDAQNRTGIIKKQSASQSGTCRKDTAHFCLV